MTHRLLARLEEQHPEISEELKAASAKNLDHTEASWITQYPTMIRFLDEDEKQYNDELNLDTSAGKIFLSFTEAAQDTNRPERWQAALNIAENLVGPIQESAHGVAHLMKGQEGEFHAFPTMTGTLVGRYENITFKLTESLTEYEDSGFADCIQILQGISEDIRNLEEQGQEANGFTPRLQAEHPELAAELESLYDRKSSRESASWIQKGEAGQTGMTIYKVYQSDRLGKSEEYKKAASEYLGKTLGHTVTTAIEDFRATDSKEALHPEAKIIDPEGYNELMNQIADYLRNRTYNGERLAGYGLWQGHQGIYETALDNLRQTQAELEHARDGVVPEERDDRSRFNDAAMECLRQAQDLDFRRGRTLSQECLRPTLQEEWWPRPIEFNEMVQDSGFQEHFQEFTTGMLRSDQERLTEFMASNSGKEDLESERQKLRAMMGKPAN